jgi:signal transduction histidine kinase
MRFPVSTISILIVDDHPPTLNVLASLLSDEGWTIRTAASGEEALKILQQEPVDIIAADYRLDPLDHASAMPASNFRITGAELVNRAVAFKPDLYSIIFTSYKQREYAVESLRAGVAAFLDKSPRSRLDEQLKAAIRRGIQAITLTRVGRQLLDLVREEDVLELVIDSLVRVKQFDGCCVVVRGDRVERAVDLRDRQELAHLEIGADSAYRYVVDHPNRVYLPPLFVPEGQTLAPFNIGSKSVAVVPITLKGGEQGALGIEHRGESSLDIEDLRFLSQIASWASLAMSNVTQQERVRVEQERSRERRDLLARAALHEIKNPLNNLATAVQVAAESLPADIAATLLENVGRINDALNRILRPLIRGEDSPPEALEIGRVIRDAVSRFRLYHGGVGTLLVAQVSPALPTIVGHRAMLVSALVNLLENSAHATESVKRKPEIRLTADYVGSRDQVEVVVSDNGRGIRDGLIDRVFDYGVTSNAAKGHTGYGLAFTRDVVNLSGGNISVSSKEGQGTTFKMTFPVHPSGPGNEELSRRGD